MRAHRAGVLAVVLAAAAVSGAAAQEHATRFGLAVGGNPIPLLVGANATANVSHHVASRLRLRADALAFIIARMEPQPLAPCGTGCVASAAQPWRGWSLQAGIELSELPRSEGFYLVAGGGVVAISDDYPRRTERQLTWQLGAGLLMPAGRTRVWLEGRCIRVRDGNDRGCLLPLTLGVRF